MDSNAEGGMRWPESRLWKNPRRQTVRKLCYEPGTRDAFR